jgi:hypothetical protein
MNLYQLMKMLRLARRLMRYLSKRTRAKARIDQGRREQLQDNKMLFKALRPGK